MLVLEIVTDQVYIICFVSIFVHLVDEQANLDKSTLSLKLHYTCNLVHLLDCSIKNRKLL